MMRKVIYLIGFIASSLTCVGYLLIVMNPAGGNNLFLIGFLGFVFVFLPLTIVIGYKSYAFKPAWDKRGMASGYLSIFLVGLSVIFKLMHLAGSPGLLIAGGGIFITAFLRYVFIKLYQNSKN